MAKPTPDYTEMDSFRGACCRISQPFGEVCGNHRITCSPAPRAENPKFDNSHPVMPNEYGGLMNFRRLLPVLLLTLCVANSAHAENLGVEEGDITKEELALLQSIAKYDKSFHYTSRAKRYFRIAEATGEKLPLRIDLIFNKTDNLYFGEYISYDVSIEPDSSIINYSFDAGTGWRGEGTVLVTSKGVIQTEKSCGTSGCEIQVFRNGKVLYQGKP